MKLSPVKLLTLYSIAYMLVAGITLAAASVLSLTRGFSTISVGDTLMQWENRWWWLAALGAVIHLLGYVKSLKRPRLLWGNLLAIWVFIAYALIPNYTAPLLLIHLFAIWLILGYHRPAEAVA